MVQPTIAQVLGGLILLFMIAFAYQQRKRWGWGKRIGYPLLVEAVWFLIAFAWESRFGSAMHQAEAGAALERSAGSVQGLGESLGTAAKTLDLDQLVANISNGLSSGNFSWLIGYWPLLVGALLLILLIGLTRWIWGHTQIPAAPVTAGTTGTTTGGTTPVSGASLQARLVNLGLSVAALAVSAVVVILVFRWTGFGQPSGRPSFSEDRRTLAAKLVDAEEFRAYQGVDFLPVLPALDAQGNVTITVEMAHGMLMSARDALIPIEQLDQRAKTPITQDVRDYIVTWVEALTLRLNQARVDPLTVPGYLEVYLKVRTLEARGLAMQDSHQWVTPPPVGGEVEKVLKLANRIAVLKVWVEDLEARNADPSVPPPTIKERQRAKAEAMTILADCESSRLMLNLGQNPPFAQAYDPIYADFLWNSRGDGLCNWAQALNDRLR